MFSIRYYCQKRPCYQLSLKNWWLCTIDPRQGLCKKFQRENYSFYHCWRLIRRPLFAQNSRASGALPRGRGPKAGSWTHPYIRERALMRAPRHGHLPPPPPFFCWNSEGWGVGWSCLFHISMIEEKNDTHPPPPPPLINYFEPAEWFEGKF